MRLSISIDKKKILATMGIALATTVNVSAYAAEFPSKPIQMIVSYGAGGSTDTMARIFAKYAGDVIGQRIVVVNRPGAGGELGWVHLANSKPDGYTIGLINSPVVEVYPITRPDSVGYTLEDIRPLANIVTDPGMLVVSKNSPYETLDDFVSAIRSNPGSVTVSHEGVGGDDHLAAIEFANAADIDLNFVSFNGNAEATAALLGGHIDAFEGNMSEAVNQINEGSLRALAIWSNERADAVSDVPTGAEQGYDVIAAASRGLAVPSGVPDEVYEKLLEVSNQVMSDPEFQAELAKLNMPLNPMYGQEYSDYINTSYERLKALWEIDPWVEE